MILTVTLNPLLEKRFYFEKLTDIKTNRTNEVKLSAGGKGINVSRQLNKLNIKNLAVTFLGGANGKKLRQVLASENIDFTVVSSKAETREAAIIVDKSKKNVTSFIGPNSEITKSESDEMINKLKKMIQNCSTLVLSGSSPNEYTDNIFPELISLAHEYDKTVILDTYGRHLETCFEKAPTIIHNNIEEIRSSLNLELNSESAIIEFLKSLYSKGIKMAFLTNGEKEVYASKFDFIYKVKFPEVDVYDPTGSGDAFVAGITYGLEKAMVFNDFLKYATALGIINATKESTAGVNKEDVEKISPEIEIFELGKKMKIIDDSPTI